MSQMMTLWQYWATARLERHVERLPLGTSYVDVIGYVKDLLRKIEQAGQTGVRPHLVVDATAVGRPIVDIFKDAGLELA